MPAKSQVTSLLRQGIAAARDGQTETARRLLTQVVEQDERNAAAWLWLSGVVESLDDKQVCLENVLTLEPGNQAAQAGLDTRQENAGLCAAIDFREPVATNGPTAQPGGRHALRQACRAGA